MKILLVTQNFYPEIGSGANRLKNIYMQLSKDHDVKVLTTLPSYPNQKLYGESKYWDEPEIDDSGNIDRIRMRIDKQAHSLRMRVFYYLELAYKVWLYVRKHQHEYDVVYVTSPNIFMPWASFFFQKKDRNIKKILEIRDLWPDSVKEIDKININMFYPALKRLEKMIYRLADKVVINNEEFRNHVHGLSPSKEILYLPNSFLRDEMSFNEVNDEFKVIYTGNIGFAQSYEQIREVADFLEEEKIVFNIVGYGFNSHKLQSYIEEQEMKYVTFHTEKNREECLEMTRDHNVALSLLKESNVFLRVLPGKVIDAIGSGVPVVANLGGHSESLINDNRVGFSKERASSHEIVDMIKHIRNDVSLESRLMKNARDLAEERFVWENNINALAKFMGS